MAYPSLPPSYYLHPNLSGGPKFRTPGSTSASSVEPITPELQPSNAAPPPDSQEESIECQWKGCEHVSPTPDALYDHLCSVHVGRKSTNNLCLTCGWEGCGVKCVKRDHITSHLRVHTPLKPHPCSVCGKTFKRPQDLKKHERIHTQEHHHLHKLSKATTSLDPAFNERVANAERHPSGDLSRSPLSTSLSPSSFSGHSQPNPSSPYNHFLPPAHAVHKSVSPTPSALAALHRKQHEELAAYQLREMLVLQQLAVQQQANHAYAAQLASEGLGVKAGQKRDFDTDEGGFDGFLADMKKRKMDPVYDPTMMNRLSNLIAPGLNGGFPNLPSLQLGGNGGLNSAPFGGPSFNPVPNFSGDETHNQTSAPPLSIPAIRTESDLALFNQFMISLGRDAINGAHNGTSNVPMTHAPSFDRSSGATSSPISDQSPIEDLFNPEELASLGLTGMPGVPIPNMSDGGSDEMSSSLPNQSISFGSMYPTLDHTNRPRTGSAGEVESTKKRAIAGLPRNNSSTSNTASRSSYSYGVGSNPYGDLQPYDTSGGEYGHSTLHSVDQNFGHFDSLARNRVTGLPATLAPRDFYKKTYRHVPPLGAPISARSRESSERTEIEDEMDEIDEAGSITPRLVKLSVQDLLLSDDQADPSLKLPAIHRAISSDPAPCPLPGVDALPRADSPLPQLPVKRHTEDEIVRGVKRLELADRSGSPAADDRRPASSRGRETKEPTARDSARDIRRRHAEMIRTLLVAVNLEWRRRRSEEMAEEREEEYSRSSTTPDADMRRLGLAEIAA